jgi:protein-disulfide isomerase
VKDYDGKLRVVYTNFVVHPQVVLQGHLGGCAAAMQGKFVAYRHEWWEKAFAPYAASQGKNTAVLGTDTILAIAKDLNLDLAKFKADMDGQACKDHVQADVAEMEKWRVGGTPAFFINGKPFQWTGSPDSFKAAVDDALKTVEASGVPCADYYEKEVMGKGLKTFRSKKDAAAGGG